MPFDAAETGASLDLLVPSMTCAGCMRKVEQAVAGSPGVVAARANLTRHRLMVRYDEAATSAEAVIEALTAIGYPARLYDPAIHGNAEEDASRSLLPRIGVAGFAAMNVMLLSVSVWSGADGATRDLFHWISALIALPAMAYAGQPFFQSAWAALKARRLNMDVPITLAITLSAASSVFETSANGAHAFFDAGIMLTFFLLIGRYLEQRTRAKANAAASELMSLAGRYAVLRKPDGGRETVPVDALRIGMTVEVAAGERIPADGTVIEGRTELDCSMITGESLPVAAMTGHEVCAGFLNVSGAIAVQITRTGDDTLLSEITRLVETAQRGKGRYDRLADRTARLYAPAVHILAALALSGWLLATWDLRLSVQVAVAVLIVTCPCALALAVPTVHTVAVGRLLKSGVFLKDGAALERLADIDTVVFDKTGTLTDGAPRITAHPPADSPVWPCAAALASASRHPLSIAIADLAADLGVRPAPVSNISEHPGLGAEGMLDGALSRLGKPDWVGGGADATVAVRTPHGDIGAFEFSQNLRSDAIAVNAALHKRGLRRVLMSGDTGAAVSSVAKAVDIEDWRAGMTPKEKYEAIAELQNSGAKVLMVGDGLNDNPALAAAHASMSPASATDATQIVADLVFTGARLAPVLDAVDLAHTARTRARESFMLAAIYNLLVIPIAMAGFVTPLMAAAAMSTSSVAVILNALRLRRST